MSTNRESAFTRRSEQGVSKVMSRLLTTLLLLAQLVGSLSFVARGRAARWGSRVCGTNPGFDAAEFERALKSAGPLPPSPTPTADKAAAGPILDQMRAEQQAQAQEAKSEQIFREYQYEDAQLPVLPECNQYYSGSFGDYFWHQNADQVYVFMPLSDDGVSKKDIDVKFAAKSVEVLIRGQRVAFFECLERIIPDGSFWVVETSDKDGKRYLQLDLEKRFRMINWKNLFGSAPDRGDDLEAQSNRSEMLKKLFAANKGMSKLIKDQAAASGGGGSDGDGEGAETMEEMLQNQDLVRMISDQVYGPRGADGADDEGQDLSDVFEDGEGVVLDGLERQRGAEGNVIDVDVEEESK